MRPVPGSTRTSDLALAPWTKISFASTLGRRDPEPKTTDAEHSAAPAEAPANRKGQALLHAWHVETGFLPAGLAKELGDAKVTVRCAPDASMRKTVR